jgi:hypothetical protein
MTAVRAGVPQGRAKMRLFRPDRARADSRVAPLTTGRSQRAYSVMPALTALPAIVAVHSELSVPATSAGRLPDRAVYRRRGRPNPLGGVVGTRLLSANRGSAKPRGPAPAGGVPAVPQTARHCRRQPGRRRLTIRTNVVREAIGGGTGTALRGRAPILEQEPKPGRRLLSLPAGDVTRQRDPAGLMRARRVQGDGPRTSAPIAAAATTGMPAAVTAGMPAAVTGGAAGGTSPLGRLYAGGAGKCRRAGGVSPVAVRVPSATRDHRLRKSGRQQVKALRRSPVANRPEHSPGAQPNRTGMMQIANRSRPNSETGR